MRMIGYNESQFLGNNQTCSWIDYCLKVMGTFGDQMELVIYEMFIELNEVIRYSTFVIAYYFDLMMYTYSDFVLSNLVVRKMGAPLLLFCLIN